MHTVEVLEDALRLAERAGFSVRRQWLDDSIGGGCRIGQQRVLFVNLSLSAEEQLAQTVAALRTVDFSAGEDSVPATLRKLLK